MLYVLWLIGAHNSLGKSCTVAHRQGFDSLLPQTPHLHYFAIAWRIPRPSSHVKSSGAKCVCFKIFLTQSPIQFNNSFLHLMLSALIAPHFSFAGILRATSPICFIPPHTLFIPPDAIINTWSSLLSPAAPYCSRMQFHSCALLCIVLLTAQVPSYLIESALLFPLLPPTSHSPRPCCR
jgi:hypothetical protein